jgi:hypothetical protein
MPSPSRPAGNTSTAMTAAQASTPADLDQAATIKTAASSAIVTAPAADSVPDTVPDTVPALGRVDDRSSAPDAEPRKLQLTGQSAIDGLPEPTTTSTDSSVHPAALQTPTDGTRPDDWLPADVPLVTPGREVRLQFEGWPAVQFAAGWPKVAMGTFGGEVVAIDATDNGQGKFRVLIRPNTTEGWPEERFLRQGVRANGWILLNQVALGYELWRQLNGFPPVYGDEKSKDGKSTGDSGATEKESKKVKLPK